MCRLIIGLGNPGAQYEGTRHNIGFMVIDQLLTKLNATDQEPGHIADSWIWTCKHAGRKILFQKPLTYMNLSGKAVARLCRKQAILPEEILLVYDDIALPLGRIRLRQKGSSGGHNGVQSLIDELGSQAFNRLRIGIAQNGGNESMSDYVLSAFDESEQEQLNDVLAHSVDAVLLAVRQGLPTAMNKYNSLGADAKQTVEKKADDTREVSQQNEDNEES